MPERYEATAARKITGLESSFRDLNTRESGYTMGDLIGAVLGFPGLRAFWPMSSVNESGNVLDLSGQGRTLTNNNAAPRAVHRDLIPYVSFNGATQYLSRADEAGLDITGALTIGIWACPTAVGVNQMVMCKDGATGQLAYHLQHTSSNVLRFQISTDGSNIKQANSAVTYGANEWRFVVGRFTPSTELALFVNGEKYTNTTSIPATIFNSNSPLAIGVWPNGGAPQRYFTGYKTLGFVCAAALPDAMINYFFHMSRTLFGV